MRQVRHVALVPLDHNTDSCAGTGSATDHDDDHPDKAKKVGFMQKMKGEAKILLGKVEGKKGHEKVEEGQKIKAGEPVH